MLSWRELAEKAWRIWRTNRRAFPPECEHCGEFMVPGLKAAAYGYQPRERSEWECARVECRYADLPKFLPFGGSNIVPPPPPPMTPDTGVLIRC